MRSFLRAQSNLALAQRSAAVAFWLAIAAVPAALVAVNVLGLVVDQQQIAQRLGQVALDLPGSLGDAVAEQLVMVAQRTPGSGGWDLLLVALALWTLSTAVVTLIGAIRATYGRQKANVAFLRAVAFALGLVGVIVVGTVGFLVAAANALGPLALASEALVGMVLLAGLLTVFYWLTGGYGYGLRRALPGALAASGGLLVVTVAVTVYADHAPTARIIYGTAAGLVVSLLATWLSVYTVLLGALVNARRLA